MKRRIRCLLRELQPTLGCLRRGSAPDVVRPQGKLHHGGWSVPLACIHELAATSQLARSVVDRADLSQFSPARHRRPGPRIRARRNFRSVREVLAACCQGAIRWMRPDSVLSKNERKLGATCIPSRRLTDKCSQMSRMRPLAFQADKRGRLQDLYDRVVGTTHADGPAHFASAPDFDQFPSGYAYTSPHREALRPVVGSRLAMPEKACTVQLSRWIHPETAALFSAPPLSLPEDQPPTGCFVVAMREWRAATRRMVRTEVGALIHANVLPDFGEDLAQLRLPAGVLAEVKDSERDRFIADRRPINSFEKSVGKTLLPYAPRARRIIIPHQRKLWGVIRDAKNFYFLLKVEDARLARQVVGPRVPKSWFIDIENEENITPLMTLMLGCFGISAITTGCWLTMNLFVKLLSLVLCREILMLFMLRFRRTGVFLFPPGYLLFRSS